jgi:phage gp29-like protein
MPIKTKALTSELTKKAPGISFFNHVGILPNPDKILGRLGKTYDTFRGLKNDPHVWSCIQSRKSGVIAGKIEIDGGESKIRDEITEIFDLLDTEQIIREILEAPLFGFQPMEIFWERRGGKFIPAGLAAAPQEHFAFSPEGNLMIKEYGFAGAKPVPDYKFIVPCFEASRINPYGESLLSKCYWPVTFKNGGLRFWVNFTEKFGMPLLLGQYTRGATNDEASRLAEELAAMSEDTVIVAPADIKIEMKEAAKSSSSELYRELIKHCNAEISKALLSQTLTTELDMGSYAAAQTHFRVRREVIASDIRLVEQSLNRLARYFAEVNYGPAKLPKISLRVEDERD